MGEHAQQPGALLSYDPSGLEWPQGQGPDVRVTPEARDARVHDLRGALLRVVEAHERGELGFMHCPDATIEAYEAWAWERLGSGITDQIVVGIGGSSLGTRAVLDTAAHLEIEGARTHFAENVDPVSARALLKLAEQPTTQLVVISKSGTTIETMSLFTILYDAMCRAHGQPSADARVVAITDPARGALRALATERGWTTFEVPPNVGGRFSVLTAVGLVPLALAGYPIAQLMRGAAEARDRAVDPEDRQEAILWACADHLELASQGVRQVVIMAYADALVALVDWFRQLWAESLGKAHDRHGNLVEAGITPISAIGAIDQHSQVQLYREGPRDKHISFLEVATWPHDLTVPTDSVLPDALSHLAGKTIGDLLDAELVGTRQALREAQRPTSRWVLQSLQPEPVGALLMAWELMTAICGEALDINAFDQPGVELGKKIAHGLLGHPAHAALAAEQEALEEAGRAVV